MSGLNNRARFFAFEGVDGTGKTSLAQHLAHQTNGKYYYSPPESIRWEREYIDNGNVEERLEYYLRGNMITSEEIAALLRESHVFCDRYVASTIINHSELLERDIPFPDLLQPDVTVFLRCSKRKIAERLQQRKSKTQYENVDFLMKVQERYARVFARKRNVVVVDTSEKSVEESADFLMDALELRNSRF